MLYRYGTDNKGNLIKKAVVYTKSEHFISNKKIDPDALQIINRLRDAGFTAYIVGGAVRDLIVGNVPKDFDIVTDATPSKIKRIFRNSRIIGRRFRLVHVVFGSKIFEVSTFRSNEEGSVGNFLKYQEKGLTYSLVNDISYAWRQINTLFALLKDQLTVKSTNSDGYEFTTQFTPLTGTVFSLAVKFGTILGASHATNVLDSFKSTFTYDALTTTDTVFACSAVINTEAAEEIAKGNFAAIVAPSFTTEAKQILSRNKKTRLVPSSKVTNINIEARFINGGILIQTKDTTLFNQWKVRTKNRPSQVQTDEMVFGMLLVMGARSYSAVLLKQNSICGIAQGCTSEARAIDGVWYEALKFTERANGISGQGFGIKHDLDTSNLGEILVCDGAIPFCDSTRKLIDSGLKAILQTGGTSSDDEFIEYCNEHGVVMVFTGMTHLSF